MRMISDRAVFTIGRLDGLWLVEHDGRRFGHSVDKEVTRAAAVKHARRLQDTGRACEIREGVKLALERL